MRTIRILLTLSITGGLLAAQEPPKAPNNEDKTNYEAAIIPVKTLSGDSFNRLAQMLRVFQVQYSSDDKLRRILVYAPKSTVDQMRRVVAELDKPGSDAAIGRNMEMNLTFLRCWPKAPAAIRPLPPDMEAVAKQLRAATQYKDIELWESYPLRLQEGREANQRVRLPMPALESEGAIGTAQVAIRPEAVLQKDDGRYVRFDRLNFNLRIPYAVRNPGANAGVNLPVNYQFMDVVLSTSGDFKEGQKSVLGKLSGVESDSSIFVVITVKVLE